MVWISVEAGNAYIILLLLLSSSSPDICYSFVYFNGVICLWMLYKLEKI